MGDRDTTSRRTVMTAAGAALAVTVMAGCKPPTEEDRYRRALGWTDVDAVRTMLDGGKDPNHRFADGDRPIHVVASASAGKAETIRLLVEKGADVHATDADGKTAWELRWGDAARTLSEDDAAVLLALIDAGVAPPKPELPKGRTLLHEVARRVPSARLISVLVTDHGLDVDARDEDGWTPLHVAAFENNAAAAEGLLQHKADPNAETTKAVGEQRKRGERTEWVWRYDAGTRPLDLFRYAAKGRFDADVRKVLEQYGATKNAAVSNEPRR